jgi:hypothetical protein
MNHEHQRLHLHDRLLDRQLCLPRSPGLIFWFARRWGGIGMLIRIVCAALFLWRIVQLLILMNVLG